MIWIVPVERIPFVACAGEGEPGGVQREHEGEKQVIVQRERGEAEQRAERGGRQHRTDEQGTRVERGRAAQQGRWGAS